MAVQVSDEAFAQAAQQMGALTPAQLEAARQLQAEQAQSGKKPSLADALIQQGILTPALRENIEARAQTRGTGGLRQLGNYKLLRKLGQGGMGAVYLAEDTMLNRQVAVKVLPKKLTENPEFLSRFKREAKAAGRLNHVNIVAAYATDEEAGQHYYVMEYCDGEPLDKRLKRLKSLPEALVIEIAIQVAQGLQYAHEHGLIHRDIKPANIFLSREGTAKILDLGLSKDVSGGEQSFHTVSGTALGTPHYISPEQAQAAKDIDGRTDVYSLGATLYHLLTGQTPFHASTAAAVLVKHITEQLPDPRDIRPDLSEGIVHVITKAMAKAPADRYANMAEIVVDLERVKAGEAPGSAPPDAEHSSIAMRAPVRRAGTGAADAVPRRTPGVGTAGTRRTGERAPAGHEAAAEHRTGRDGQAEGVPAAEPVAPSNRIYLIVGGSVAAVLLVVGLILAFSGGDKPPETAKVEPEPEQGEQPASPPNQPAKPEQPSADPRSDLARRLLELLRKEEADGKPIAELRERYEALARNYGETTAGREAAERLKSVPVPGPVPVAERPWKPVFDGKTLTAFSFQPENALRVENGVIVKTNGFNAWSRTTHGDGEVRFRFEVADPLSGWGFGVRHGGKGEWGIWFDRSHVAALASRINELVFTCRGDSVSAELNGKPVAANRSGEPPRQGNLSFSAVAPGSLRIRSIEFREPAPEQSATPADRFWKPIFDGRTLECLVDQGGGAWRVEGGALVKISDREARSHTQSEFEDGEVRIRFMPNARYAEFKMRWCNDPDGKFSAQFSDSDLKAFNGGLQTLTFSCRGNMVTATVNGAPWRVTQTGSPRRGKLQIYVPNGDDLRIFSIEHRDLAPESLEVGQKDKDGWTCIFNGRDLTGWRVYGDAKTEDGAIVLTDPGKEILRWVEWPHYELRGRVRLLAQGPYPVAVYIYLRSPTTATGTAPTRVRILRDGEMDLGSSVEPLYRANDSKLALNEWQDFVLRLVGDRLGVEVAGKLVLSGKAGPAEPGFLGIQGVPAPAKSAFKDLQLRELGPDGKPLVPTPKP